MIQHCSRIIIAHAYGARACFMRTSCSNSYSNYSYGGNSLAKRINTERGRSNQTAQCICVAYKKKMSLSKPRTTFNAEELERLSGAQHRLYGMYEVLGKSPINIGSGANTVLVPPQQNRQKDSKTYEPQYFDSGLGDELPEDWPPKPPLLMTDIENQDSGIGPESMDTDEDDTETDGIRVGSSSRSATTNNVERRTHPKAPRRPKINHLKTANPVTTISNSRVKVNTTSKSRSLHIHSVPREQPAVTVRRTNTAAARVNWPKVENTRSKTWESTIDIFSFQRHIQYFLPNKDGDT